MVGIPARPPASHAFQRSGRRRQRTWRLHGEASADRERIGAVKDIAGARGVDDIDRIGRLAVRAAPFSYQLTPVLAARDRQPRGSRSARSSPAPHRSAEPAKPASAGSENTAWSVSGSSVSKTLGLRDVAVEYRRNAERARLGEQRDGALRPARIGEHGGRRRSTSSSGSQSASVRKLATEIHDLPFAGPIDDDAGDRRTTVRKQSELR